MDNYNINSKIAKDKGFYKLYPFTSENISGYIDSFDLNNKSLLTVGSSSDQVINANIKGVKNVTLLDIAPNTIYYYYLKLASLYDLSLDEFLKFLSPTCFPKFYKRNNDLYNIESFNKIKNTLKALNSEAYEYWNNIFNNLKPNEILNSIFIEDINDNETVRRNNIYLKNNILFDEAKEKMKKANTNFITGDVSNITINDKYDNIWFSNIIDYIEMNKYIEIIKNFSNLLNEDGTLLIAYLYNIFFSFDTFDVLRDNYDLKKLRLELEKANINTNIETFEAINKGKKDAVLTYKRH